MRKEQLNRTSILEVHHFSFAYETLEKPVLDNLTFTLNKDEVTLLMGSSGSGKSSLALCLNSLYPDGVEGFSAGDIYFQGKNISDFPKGVINQHIGIVFQDPESQFCMITVEDELAFALENRKIPASEMPHRISEVLQIVGMEAYKERKIHELSGGQKQKIALAAVLLLEPELLILDEPTANLDPASSMEFIHLISEIQKERTLSVLIIEHQADDWIGITDRMIVLGKNGKILADEKPHRLFSEGRQLLEQEGIFPLKEFVDTYRFQSGGSSTSSEVILSVKEVSFRRKQRVILKEINMDIHKGECIAIIGENGAGKSTLLQLMSGLLQPTKGNIVFLDQALKRWKENELRKRMGYVFQNPEHQFITDTVYDELTFGMKLNRYEEEKMNQTATTLMNQFHLENHRFSNPFSLSGGQKRRLSVATMLDETPDILFFDEPTFGQDATTTKEMMEMIRQLKENGTTIVFVTHDMEIVDSVERVFVLCDQRIAFTGKPEQLWERESLLQQARLRFPYRILKNA
ncbi:ABC transporter ATP-binding protein [Oceanobacillus senegalensis]|uniref:ABC transporter ATP-binding protein n=1 Tax=Oceanobacillus senegalensis TaxID=1936063 RepID=UPI000A312E01|nr:ABC transporter ATP-binding protein [Oceanobacillus senegalensis]